MEQYYHFQIETKATIDVRDDNGAR